MNTGQLWAIIELFIMKQKTKYQCKLCGAINRSAYYKKGKDYYCIPCAKEEIDREYIGQ